MFAENERACGADLLRKAVSEMDRCRRQWIELLVKTVDPVLVNFSHEKLHEMLKLPPENADREQYKGLEILGRTLSGIAPWIERGPAVDRWEEALRKQYADLSRQAISAAVDPASPDYCFNGTEEKEWNRQWLVDAAFLALAILRSPKELGEKLPHNVRQNLENAFLKTRNYRPVFNNWLLFSAIVEAALFFLGRDYDIVRIDYAIRQMEQWYVGDGFYGDGPKFRMDYYNSFVIQPMLVYLVRMFHDKYRELDAFDPAGGSTGDRMYRLVMRRFKRYVQIQEASIAPDGSFAPVGRSLFYRCGAFHALAQAALWRELPEDVTPAMARGALTRVIRKTLNAPGTFSEEGWLQLGVCGHQPGIAVPYCTTASLYLATSAFLPLGLPETDAFWTTPEEKGTWEKCFTAANLQPDLPLERDEKLF